MASGWGSVSASWSGELGSENVAGSVGPGRSRGGSLGLVFGLGFQVVCVGLLGLRFEFCWVLVLVCFGLSYVFSCVFHLVLLLLWLFVCLCFA